MTDEQAFRFRVKHACACRVWATDRPCEMWRHTLRCPTVERWLSYLSDTPSKKATWPPCALRGVSHHISMTNAINAKPESVTSVWVALRCLGAASTERLVAVTALTRVECLRALSDLRAEKSGAELWTMPESEMHGA